MAEEKSSASSRSRIDLATIIGVLALCGSTVGWVFNYVSTIRDLTNANTLNITYLQANVSRLESTMTQNQRDVRDDLHDINGKLDRLLIGTPQGDNQPSSVKKWTRQ